jgi:very-short-patch-repair endonuclease
LIPSPHSYGERVGARFALAKWEGEGQLRCIMRGPNPAITTRARVFRRTPTAAEAKLWQVLRNRKVEGAKFARQDPIGPYFADFCCRAKKLVIEIDGVTHDTPESVAYDFNRTTWLKGEGYRVIRFRNEDILAENIDAVLETIRRSI